MNSKNGKGVPLLELSGIDKSFPGVRALKNVSLTLNAGKVLALVGENGAGKSTLIKILGGVYQADEGNVLLEGKRADLRSPKDAQQKGISVIYQEFNLISDLKVHENIFLGREKTRRGFVDSKEEIEKSIQLFDKIGVHVDPLSRCRVLSIAEQQIVEIAKALSKDARLIIMDEPSAVLTGLEVRQLFKIIDDLKSHGVGVIYVSHRLDEIFEIADDILVLRDGLKVAQTTSQKIDRDILIESMVGRPLESEFPTRIATDGGEAIRVENLKLGSTVKGVSFSANEGEILGFAGLVGAGRTAVMRMIFGADIPDSGHIFLKECEVKIREPKDAVDNHICLLTEDRKEQGLVLAHGCQDNFALPNLDRFSRGIFLDEKEEARQFNQYIDKLKIKLADKHQSAGSLSGGNQQKLVLAKWLVRNAKIIIFDEPTRGIDVGAKYEIYELINELADQRKTVIMVSSELEELIGMCDRIIVMHEGSIKGEISDLNNTSQEQILSLAVA